MRPGQPCAAAAAAAAVFGSPAEAQGSMAAGARRTGRLFV